ncbi:hypothetical protein HmCmsJML041_02175 [Escherichia coli]|nr:hypothetical protein HmCmsJML041_02175 [Escherichia coli]
MGSTGGSDAITECGRPQGIRMGRHVRVGGASGAAKPRRVPPGGHPTRHGKTQQGFIPARAHRRIFEEPWPQHQKPQQTRQPVHAAGL